MNWIFRILGSLLVLAALVVVLVIAENDVSVPAQGKAAVKPVQPDEDASMKGMKIN